MKTLSKKSSARRGAELAASEARLEAAIAAVGAQAAAGRRLAVKAARSAFLFHRDFGREKMSCIYYASEAFEAALDIARCKERAGVHAAYDAHHAELAALGLL
jgi:hypothetical protein